MIEFIADILAVFAAAYAVVATVSLLVGFARFLLEAPRAIREDSARRRKTRPQPPGVIKFVRNEAADESNEIEAPAGLPPHDGVVP